MTGRVHVMRNKQLRLGIRLEILLDTVPNIIKLLYKYHHAYNEEMNLSIVRFRQLIVFSRPTLLVDVRRT